MKTCPKCGELNGNDKTECFKCKTKLAVSNYRKVCPKCGVIFSQNATHCDKCGTILSVYDENISYEQADNPNSWLYLVAVLFPYIGLILGCVYIAKNENELGKSLLFTSIITSILLTVFGICIVSCNIL